MVSDKEETLVVTGGLLMKILISPLGLAPGVVTGAYYALRDQNWGEMDAIITVSTTSDLTKLCEREIEAELGRARQELGVSVKYQQQLSIPSDEVRNSSDVFRFRRIILDLLQTNPSAGDHVYLSLTGGRKSMVAAAAMAAQVCKPKKIFHVFVDEEVERDGHITALLKKPTDKRRFYLNPPTNKIGLVEIPLLSLGERGIDVTQWLARIFEFAVGAYLSTQLDPPFTQIEYKFHPDYFDEKGLGEVDILASRQVDDHPEFLLCECKMREESVQTEWLDKLARKRQKVVEKLGLSSEQVKAWIVTIVSEIQNAQKAREHGIEVYQAQLPKNWRNRADWEVENISPLIS
jgi:CRISPR-associated protein (TIGR02584 family)